MAGVKGASYVSRVKQWPVIVPPYRRPHLRNPRSSRAEEQSARAREIDEAVKPSSESSATRRPLPPSGSSRRPSAPAGASAETVSTRTTDLVRGVKSTGIFEVPEDTVIQLVVAISSFSAEEQTAAVRVRRMSGEEPRPGVPQSGVLQPVFFRLLRIEPGGARRVTVDGLGGERIEVEVTLSSHQLVPTAAVTQFFPADAGLLVLTYKSPGDFVTL